MAASAQPDAQTATYDQIANEPLSSSAPSFISSGDDHTTANHARLGEDLVASILRCVYATEDVGEAQRHCSLLLQATNPDAQGADSSAPLHVDRTCQIMGSLQKVRDVAYY
jgi:hypothetical protein